MGSPALRKFSNLASPHLICLGAEIQSLPEKLEWLCKTCSCLEQGREKSSTSVLVSLLTLTLDQEDKGISRKMAFALDCGRTEQTWVMIKGKGMSEPMFSETGSVGGKDWRGAIPGSGSPVAPSFIQLLAPPGVLIHVRDDNEVLHWKELKS